MDKLTNMDLIDKFDKLQDLISRRTTNKDKVSEELRELEKIKQIMKQRGLLSE